MNDLVHEEVVAVITEFEVEGQESSTISKATRTAAVTLPAGSDLKSLKVKTFSVTEGATCEPSVTVGGTLDLSRPLTLTLTTYDPYTWTLQASVAGEVPPANSGDVSQDPSTDPSGDASSDPDTSDDPSEEEFVSGPQLYNMSFDHWSTGKDKIYSIEAPVLYDEDATDGEKAVWGSAASSTKMLGYNSVLPETEFLAVKGDGKKALKLQTCGIEALFGAIKKLAAGSVFCGKTGNIDIAKMSAHILWGIPFTERPARLEGYYCYQPKPIDWVQAPYEDKKGTLDNGHVLVILSDWAEPFDVCPPDQLLDVENNPGIIGFGKAVFDKEMTDYEKFTIDIEYRSERIPTMVTIVCSSSALGDYFTGGAGSVLYLDELSFLYRK